MQWNFHVEDNNINVKYEITYLDCESIRTNNWKEVCLFNIWKTGFYAKIETFFIPQLMTSSTSSTWIFIVIEKTVQNAI